MGTKKQPAWGCFPASVASLRDCKVLPLLHTTCVKGKVCFPLILKEFLTRALITEVIRDTSLDIQGTCVSLTTTQVQFP
jgi:hypothetical protein